MNGLIAAVVAGALCFPAAGELPVAEEIPLVVTLNGEAAPESLLGSSYTSAVSLAAGETLTLSGQAGEKLYGVYIVWAAAPGPWTLEGNGREIRREEGYLHAYVPIPEGAEAVTLRPQGDEAICYLRAYTAGTLPEDVQQWQPPCEQADILLFPAHADDEILFFGGVLAEYAGERDLAVQVAYFSQYSGVREHEKLDGLWASGVENYPVNGPFRDEYQATLAAARAYYGQETAEEFYAQLIRRFRPQVCVCHDAAGEYGHGTHCLTSCAARAAAESAGDESYFPDSAAEYGAWDVPKTYLHLGAENPIHLDCRRPLAAFGGQTALEVAKGAYLCHASQQWCWFYVSDDNAYSIADFGLCRSTVGPDTGGDMMEHLQPYGEKGADGEESPR